MNIKLLSCILIVFSSTGIGYILSNTVQRRMRFLIEFKRTVKYTQNIISYKNEPFINMVNDVVKNTKKDVSELYLLVCRAIGKSYNFYDRMFRNDIECLLEEKALTKEDIGVISDYFSDVGSYDKAHQMRSINDITKRLDQQISDAKKCSDANSKIYLSFSVMAGVLICIIMI